MDFNNQVALIGNLGADPDLKYSANGVAVLKFRMATKSTYKDRQGASHESTQWHNIVMFGERAAALCTHLHKGSYIRVTGSIRYNTYEKDGEKRTSTDIVADNCSPAAFPKTSDRSNDDGASEAAFYAHVEETPAPAPARVPQQGSPRPSARTPAAPPPDDYPF